MGKGSEIAAAAGGGTSRKSKMNKSFKVGLRSLLTASSIQGFTEAFPNFTTAEQERLHGLFIQVLTSLHGNIEDDFESLCDETQVGTILEMIEQDVEEQTLDPLFPNKMNVDDVGVSLSAAKKNEIQNLTTMLEKAGEQKHIIGVHIELLKSRRQDFPGSAYDVEQALNSNVLQ